MHQEIIKNAPEDYLCQLTYDFMQDPVRIPTSDLIVDWKAIK